jgi:hypothetical protein
MSPVLLLWYPVEQFLFLIKHSLTPHFAYPLSTMCSNGSTTLAQWSELAPYKFVFGWITSFSGGVGDITPSYLKSANFPLIMEMKSGDLNPPTLVTQKKNHRTRSTNPPYWRGMTWRRDTPTTSHSPSSSLTSVHGRTVSKHITGGLVKYKDGSKTKKRHWCLGV